MTRPSSDIARTATWTAPGSGIPWSTSLKLRAARDSGGSGGPSSSSGGGEDPFEAFYAHPGGLV